MIPKNAQMCIVTEVLTQQWCDVVVARNPKAVAKADEARRRARASRAAYIASHSACPYRLSPKSESEEA